MGFLFTQAPYLVGPIFTTIQIAVAMWLFARSLPRREGFAWRMVVAGCAVAAFVSVMTILGSSLESLPFAFFGLPWIDAVDMVFTSQLVTFSLVILLCYALVLFLFDTVPQVALFCVSAGYIMQNIASGLDGLMRTILVPMGVSVDSWGFTIVGMVGLCAAVYVLCYQTIVRKIEQYGFSPVHGGSALAVVVMVVLVCLAFDLANKCFLLRYGVPTHMVVLYRGVHFATCAFVLWMEFELLYNKHLEQDIAVMQRVRSDEERQYQLSKDTIDAINIKCHDIRHQIRHLEQGGVAVEKGALEDLAQEVRIYDSKVKTGNEALDTILSEKRLLCEREGIRLTCIADGAVLLGLSPADLYSLFGNLLDNAIEAVRRLGGEERKTISLVVSRRGDMAVIHEENYFDGEARFEDGLPISTKGDPLNHGFGTRSMRQIVERYGGSMTMHAQGDRFAVTIVLPT
jgi:hypothetical protein